MNTMVKLPDSRWPGWRRRLYWWMHEAVEAEEVISSISRPPASTRVVPTSSASARCWCGAANWSWASAWNSTSSRRRAWMRSRSASTKLRRADLEGQLQLEQALRQVLAFIGDRPLLGYYLSFDVAVLNRHLRQLLDRQLHNPSIEISSLYHRKVSRHFPDAHIDLRFDTLARALDVPVSGRHTALGDAQAVALMFMRLLKGPAPKVIH